MFMVLSSWPKVIVRVHPVYVMNVDCVPGGQMLQMPVDLGCESAENWQLSSTSTIAVVIITQPVDWYSFYRPTKDGRLSRPKYYADLLACNNMLRLRRGAFTFLL